MKFEEKLKLISIKPYYTLPYNQLSSNPIRVFWATFLTNKTTFLTNKTILTQFILIKT